MRGEMTPVALTVGIMWAAIACGAIVWCRVEPVATFFLAALLALVVIWHLVWRMMTREEEGMLEARQEDEERFRVRLTKQSAELDQAERAVKDRELVMVNLYEVTKKMSGSLRFDDIFAVFSLFLKEHFAFRRCDLLVLHWEGGSPHLERRYTVWKAEGGEAYTAGPQPAYLEHLVKTFSPASSQAVWLARDGDAARLEALGLLPDGVDTFCVIPLLSEKRVVAILTIEDLPKADFDKMVIVSMQCALEIKKVLLYETVERLAITDSLTGLFLRRYFTDRLDEELNRSKHYGFKFAFLIADIDDFKKCNDTYGHLVGDVILRDVARIMKESVREIDLVARYGGEEFAVILPETGSDGTRFAAERIRKKVEEHIFKAYDEQLRVTISIGVAVYPDDADDARDLIERADTALYRAKKSGKNLVCSVHK